MGFEQTKRGSQLFVKRRDDGSIKILLAMVTDVLLLAGSEEAMRDFVAQVSPQFKVCKTIVNSTIKFNGCQIVQDEEGTIRIDM